MLRRSPAVRYARGVAKRVFDVTVTLFVAPFAAIPVVIFAAILAVELRGSPFFVQTRIGEGGKPFRMYKLRTMRHAVPGQAKQYRITDWSQFVFAPPGERDPRLTRWGEIARKASIDELPNLVNVFKGEMSLVGPRPEIPEIVAQYPPAYHRRHTVLPGIAGLAQVSGRSDLAYDEIVRFDLDYVDRHSVLGDIGILMKTAAMVARGSGAR